MSQAPRSHRIRLQGPWQVRPPGDESSQSLQDVRIPASWESLFGQTAGTAIFHRKFNTPTGLSPESHLQIRLPDHCGTPVSVTLNGRHLQPGDEPGLFLIADELREFNQLAVSIHFNPADAPGQPGGLWKPVLLEISDG